MGGTGICIGGLTIPDLVSVRLLKSDGSYHDVSTSFNVGQLWEIEYSKAKTLTPPHIENVLINKSKLISANNNITDIIDGKKLKSISYAGSPTKLFDGMLGWTGSNKGYISKIKGIPSHSTGFWVTDEDLVLEGKDYFYEGDNNNKYGFKYVGYEKAIEIIPAGTKVRVSLAKWWKPDDIDIELRCYLQLSGWYL